MDDKVKKIIDQEIIPLVEQGKCALFVGAGFSVNTPTKSGKGVPSTSALIDRILSRLKYDKKEIDAADLGDAFAIGQDEIQDFPKFIEENFLVRSPLPWQKKTFLHWWRRVYTTNIDDCLNRCFEEIEHTHGDDGPKHAHFNFKDRSIIENDPTVIPLVSLHGSVRYLSDGFVFDSVEYADVTVKRTDWLSDAALNLSHGNCILLGSKFREPDIEAALRQRATWDKNTDFTNPNWIVLRNVERAREAWYEKRNIKPLICDAEEFCTYLNERAKTITASRYLRRFAPHIGLGSRLAGGWFAKSFEHVPEKLSKAKFKPGIVSRFFSGDAPTWYYIEHKAPASFQAAQEIIDYIRKATEGDHPVHLVTVTGGVATGKTTACMTALSEISRFNSSVYFFDPLDGVDVNFLWDALKDTKGDIILCFDRSSEHFYALNQVARRLQERPLSAKIIFIVEERTSLFDKNTRHLSSFNSQYTKNVELGVLSQEDGRNLFLKLQENGMATGPLEGKDEKAGVSLILDKDRGFRGDLLSTLCEVTSHESFRHKIRDEYNGIASDIARNIFETICIISSVRIEAPLVYLCDIHEIRMGALISILKEDLQGKVLIHSDRISARHFGIAEYIMKSFISDYRKAELIINICLSMSDKFSIEDIIKHPVSYRIYKNLLSYRFLSNSIKCEDRFDVIEGVYSACQVAYARDGIFWLQYGRFLEKFDRIDDALHCLRKGLGLYDSFQIRHALGDVLLKSFVLGGGVDENLYDEGLEFLENELVSRGVDDSYVPTTLVDRLLDVYEVNNSSEALGRARQILNDFMQYHDNDDSFKGVIQRLVRVRSKFM